MASDDFYLVLPSNSSTSMYPNNTLAQYVTNLPRRVCLSGEWECGLTEIHYPHDWYNVRKARLTIAHGDTPGYGQHIDDGYYDSPSALVRALNGEKGGRVKILVRSGHPEGVHANEGQHDVQVVRRSDRYTRVPGKTRSER